MPYLNGYTAPEPLQEGEYHASTPREEYDLNFCYPVPEERLETKGGVRIVPLIPSLHGARLFQLFSAGPDGFRWLPYGPFPTYAAFLTLLEFARRDSGTLLFAVYDLALEFDDGVEEDFEVEAAVGLREERIAGIVGVLKSVPANRMTEIGHLHIPAPFQRTHVLTHSISLVLSWLLDAPSPSMPSALGLRRVQWFANASNAPSIRAAERLGLAKEGEHLAWERILPPAKDGMGLPAFLQGKRREDELKRGSGRHSSVLAMGWDRWEEGGRDKVRGSVEREVKVRKAREVPGLLPA
ncbi:hypothetical protein JCM21900_001683 [Sporobolomyces salmonicolor]